jgi:hypothetical protein
LQSERLVIITYVLHMQTPSQLWKMELVGSRRTPYGCARLAFRHVFSSTVPVGYVGSTFGGKSDQFIVCAGKCLICHFDLA